MEDTIIKIRSVSATYGKGSKLAQALRRVSLDIRKGEIFGLLGPNGAGKTTLLSCLEGLKKPDEGTLHVDGIDVLKDPTSVKNKLGVQLQRTALLDDLTVAELVGVYAALYQVYLGSEEIDLMLARFDLTEQRNKLGRRLSGGQSQRLALALAIANDPQIVLLDEPTAALDPHARRSVWGIIRLLHDEGRTIVITTHSMEEAEALCGRVGIIDRGEVIACDSPARLINGLDASSVLKTNLDLSSNQIKLLPEVRSYRYSGQYLELETTQPQATMSALQDLASEMGRSLGEIMLRQPNLEDVFLKLTGKPLSS